jgi:hypothetical protein
MLTPLIIYSDIQNIYPRKDDAIPRIWEHHARDELETPLWAEISVAVRP